MENHYNLGFLIVYLCISDKVLVEGELKYWKNETASVTQIAASKVFFSVLNSQIIVLKKAESHDAKPEDKI